MHRSVQIAAIATITVLCACRQKEASPSGAEKVKQAGAQAIAAPHGSFDSATRTLTVLATDFAYALPDSITAGWTTVHLANDGTQLHHAQIVRLDSGKTYADLVTALKTPGPFPAWAVLDGGPNAPNPPGRTDATLDLEPGQYAIICLVDLGDHVPHFAKGMIHPLTVLPNSGTKGTEPVGDVTVSLSDYSFAIQGALTAGTHTIKVVNAGPQPHEAELIRLAPGKTVKDFMAWVDKTDGSPPASGVGGVATMVKGGTTYFTADLTPGNYALVCFVPDAKDGKRHFDHGMFKAITVS